MTRFTDLFLPLSILVFALGTVAGNEPDGAWLSEVERRITRAEYEITWQTAPVLEDLAESWHAPNRVQGFRTYFTQAGIRVVPRTTETPSWEWSLSLAGWGRPGAVQAVGAALLRPESNRLEYDRGRLVEWYVNEARGLEQGFTLAGPAPFDAEDDLGSAPPHEVWIELVLGGTLRPIVSTDGQAIDFATPGGAPAIHYAHLEVADATGRALPARMEGFPGGIRLVFEDENAVYPVTVDPLATAAAWTAESDQADALFGVSVATAGDVNGDGYADVIVGAQHYDNGETNEGRAYLYLGSAAGLSAVEAWTAEGDQVGAVFGTSVATAGDVNGDGYADVIVGAENYDNGETSGGRVFVYHGSAAGLSPSADWTASDQDGSLFGNSVATAGDVNGDGFADVIVGAPWYTNGEFKEGRAYVYHGSAAGLSPSAAWTAESDQVGAGLGSSVATAGDVNGDGYFDVIVGAISYDNGETDEGRAYVYHGSAVGLSPSADWTAESDQPGAFFGNSVATAGDVNGDGYADVIVGAERYNNGQVDEGRAFVYHGSAVGLSPSADWTAESDQIVSKFGFSVATAGDINGDGYSDVIVGAKEHDNGETDEGQAFVYHGSATGLSTRADWTAESNQTSAQLGVSVATAGDVNGDGYADVIVGALVYDNGESDEGRAYVYLGSAAGLSAVEAWTAESDQEGGNFGSSVGTAGDVNGDGYSDVVVGAHDYDNGETDEGRAYVYLGSAAGLSAVEAWTAESDQAGARFGWSVATAGDVNGDGYSDVIVGAYFYDSPVNGEGRAYVYLGSAAGLSAVEVWTVEGDQVKAHLGQSVSTAGDVNGDGYSDVIVGAPLISNGEADEGRAYLFLGSATGLSAVEAWTAEGDQAFANFGNPVATAGDINGDSYSDVIVGADGYDNGELGEGRAYVYLGSAAGLSTVEAWTAEGDQAFANFGISVATAGDVNGDGFSDVIVGANGYENGEADEGRAYVYLGSAAGLSAVEDWTAESDLANALFGQSVSTAGDVNGDGYSDVIVGAWKAVNGRAYTYLGSPAGLSAVEAWTVEGDQAGAVFGGKVATAGDVNGDGYSDVIVGAFRYDNPEGDEGRAYVYYGNDGAGLSLQPQQRRANDSAPIDSLGTSGSPDSFRLALLGRTPFGRGKVKLEWEVKPLGTSFDGTGTSVSSSWMDTGTAGTTLNELVSGLANDTVHHWRVRLLYDPVTVPFQQASRWLTVPWNGWQETDLRTNVANLSAGRVPDGDTLPGVPLTVDKAAGEDITLSWGASCTATDDDYEIYQGTIGNFNSHDIKFCDTGGDTTKTFAPAAGSTYYLVVPTNGNREGSYGRDGENIERPVGVSTCAEQDLAGC